MVHCITITRLICSDHRFIGNCNKQKTCPVSDSAPLQRQTYEEAFEHLLITYCEVFLHGEVNHRQSKIIFFFFYFETFP